MKKCKRCAILKPLEDFTVNRAMRDGKSVYCKPCAVIRNKAWREANPEKTQKSQHKQWLRAKENGTYERWEKANHEKRMAQDRARYDPAKAQIKNARYRTESPEAFAASKKSWTQAHPDIANAWTAARRARLNGAPINDFTVAEWSFLKDLYGHSCAYCGQLSQRLTKDHVIALSEGGSHTLSNILPVCKSCNSKKHATKFIIPLLLRCADGEARPPDAFVPQWRIPVPVVVPKVSNVSQTQTSPLLRSR